MQPVVCCHHPASPSRAGTLLCAQIHLGSVAILLIQSYETPASLKERWNVKEHASVRRTPQDVPALCTPQDHFRRPPMMKIQRLVASRMCLFHSHSTILYPPVVLNSLRTVKSLA